MAMRILLAGDNLNTPIITKTAKELGHEITCVTTSVEIYGMTFPGTFDVALITHDHGDRNFLLNKEDILKIPIVAALCSLSQAEGCYNITALQNQALNEYYMYSGKQNIRHLFYYVEALAGHTKFPPVPVVTPFAAIFDSNEQFFQQGTSYINQLSCKYSYYVGLLTYRTHWQGDDLEVEKALILRLNALGIGVIPAFYADGGNEEEGSFLEAIQDFFYQDGKLLIQGLINLMFAPCTGTIKGTGTLLDKAVRIYETMNLPIFHPMEDSVLQYDYAELQGLILPLHIAEQKVKRIHSVKEEALDLFVKRVVKYATLKKKKNKDKRVAIMLNASVCAGVEATLGRAEGLDTFASVLAFMHALKEEGYVIDQIPSSPKKLQQLFLQRKAYSNFRWTSVEDIVECGGDVYQMESKEYLDFYKTLPIQIQEEIESAWGKPLGESMVYKERLIITGLLFGNVIVCIQPKRGCYGAKCTGEVCKILQDPACPPTHQYFATYHYLRDFFQADMLIQVGTHGSLEYTPDSAMMQKGINYPNLVLGDLPFYYLFSGAALGAALLAKRRSCAVIIDHNVEKEKLHTINSREIKSIKNACDAGYVKPGSCYREDEIGFVSGRNLFGIEIGRIPEKSAYERGKLAANQCIQKYIKENGEYPQSLSIHLTASDVVKTRGEQISMVLALLGIVPVYGNTGQVLELKAIPTDQLVYPRVDVCIQVSSLLRETWPRIMELADEAVLLAASQEESVDQNYLRKHMEKDQISCKEELYRIYTTAPGTFTNSLKLALKASAWEKREDLASYYLNSSSYGYKKGQTMRQRPKEFLTLASHVKATCSLVSEKQTDGLKSSYISRMQGGIELIAKIANPGNKIKKYVSMSDTSGVRTKTLKEYVADGLNQTLLNDEWKEKQLKNGYEGAAEIMTRIQSVFDIQCLGEEFTNEQLKDLVQGYLLDEKTREQMQQNNPYAAEEVGRRMLELSKRGYFHASNELLNQMASIYLSLEGDLEEQVQGEGQIQAGEVTIVTQDMVPTWKASLKGTKQLISGWNQ